MYVYVRVHMCVYVREKGERNERRKNKQKINENKKENKISIEVSLD